MKLTMDIDSLTLREIEDFETASGMGIGQLGAGMPARALRAFVWILRRREDPSYTFEQAGDVRVGELGELVIEEPPANPT